jgi:hypothetical protein
MHMGLSQLWQTHKEESKLLEYLKFLRYKK